MFHQASIQTGPQNRINRFILILLSILLGFTLIALNEKSSKDIQAEELSENYAYFPLVLGASSQVTGFYHCDETENGFSWRSWLMTLKSDGTALYQENYSPSYTTGTWDYAPSSDEVTFTNFRWNSATYIHPDTIGASQYLPEVGYLIGLRCYKREPFD